MEANATYKPLTADEIQKVLQDSVETCPLCEGWIKWETVPDWYDDDVFGECQTEGCYADLVSTQRGVEVLSHE